MSEHVTIEQVREFYDMLTGAAIPDNIRLGRSAPRLSQRKAFSVIWFLQEQTGIIPDIYERCDKCGSIYDSEQEGRFTEKRGHRCDRLWHYL